MKKIVFFDTSYGTQNMGDFIINRAISEELSYLMENKFVVRYGTHNPILRWTQSLKKNSISKYCAEADYKFICGTNLLNSNLNHIIPNFNINLYDAKNYAGAVLIGCGCGNNKGRTNLRTRLIYKKALSHDFIHSVRDARAERFVRDLGLDVINTGCPTLWKLTKVFCGQIPQEKAKSVVFTLTDYCKDHTKDQQLINILKANYEKVFFWVQGSEDFDYLKSFNSVDGIELIFPNLDAYEKVLKSGEIDYVGTRLHAGIFAMRHKVRSIILVVDNRARDMKRTYNLPAIERNDINKLERLINSLFVTDVKIDEKKIAKWKAQFE